MRNYRILLVDDDPFILTGIGKDLESSGYDVTPAKSGERAIELMENGHFDMVITDLVMDRVDGIDVLKTAKANNPETMVLILTGYGDMESAIDALRLDADDYLLKPCEPDEMKLRVSRYFERLELKRKLRLYETMLPVCCVCKKIRDDSGREPGTGKWMTVEQYIWEKAGISPTSTYCPECAAAAKKEIGIE
ncbi:response regulator [uncultured Desulfosarcina sp.]|uniref:response regulator n=1 Tax=uncultured Desulfosarcina sp. TaxID=218289 RepID=UPI0029C8A2ED|nr:response regulator [uncultured Desulfosarcina sp.]